MPVSTKEIMSDKSPRAATMTAATPPTGVADHNKVVAETALFGAQARLVNAQAEELELRNKRFAS